MHIFLRLWSYPLVFAFFLQTVLFMFLLGSFSSVSSGSDVFVKGAFFTLLYSCGFDLRSVLYWLLRSIRMFHLRGSSPLKPQILHVWRSLYWLYEYFSRWPSCLVLALSFSWGMRISRGLCLHRFYKVLCMLVHHPCEICHSWNISFFCWILTSFDLFCSMVSLSILSFCHE